MMTNTATRYEVVAEAAGKRLVLGYTARKTKLGLLDVARQKGEAVIALLDVADDSVPVFKRLARSTWVLEIGAGVVKFSGATERHPSAVA